MSLGILWCLGFNHENPIESSITANTGQVFLDLRGVNATPAKRSLFGNGIIQ